jgi:dTDP-4-dehydrorhamnose reductase
MKRMMVTGAGGMTGREVSDRARSAGWEVLSLSHTDLDITDADAVARAVRRFGADVIVNCAAYTAVDSAESEPEIAASVNAAGARNVAKAAAGLAPLIHISTDYVFGGDGPNAYAPDAETSPIGVYGKTKLAGEIAVREETHSHVIVRTSWVFSHRGHNFVRTMLRLATERDEIRVVDDQIGRPTSAADLADALLVVAANLLENRAVAGTYHFANTGETSWFGFARAIFEEATALGEGYSPRLVAVKTSEFPTAARRPANSILDTATFTERFGVVPRPWREALHDCIANSVRSTLAGT